jgi:hypothetical protein
LFEDYEQETICQKCSRHRAEKEPAGTPEGYYNLDI